MEAAWLVNGSEGGREGGRKCMAYRVNGFEAGSWCRLPRNGAVGEPGGSVQGANWPGHSE